MGIISKTKITNNFNGELGDPGEFGTKGCEGVQCGHDG